MSYELLNQAPKDHNSQKFLDFLVKHNKIVFENDDWLIVENCKYHNKDGHRGWHTAFIKSNAGWFLLQEDQFKSLKSAIIEMGYSQWEMRLKKPSERTVKRLHVHFIE